jgi:hypothetical protein
MNDKMNGKLITRNDSEKGSEFIDEDGEKFVECNSNLEENEGEELNNNNQSVDNFESFNE